MITKFSCLIIIWPRSILGIHFSFNVSQPYPDYVSTPTLPELTLSLPATPNVQPLIPPYLYHIPKDTATVQCDICYTTYRGSDKKRSLRRHIKSVHDGVKDHVCQFCGRKFGRKYTLATHVARLHADQLEAPSSQQNNDFDQ